MAAQEFSSPGEHMASMSSSPDVNGGSAFRNPNRQNWDSDNIVVGQAPIYYGSINNAFDDYREARGYTGGSARSFAREAHDFNNYYMSYNDSLFNSAKDYDMYMSNSAIQRQVEDLKKAGLNPILAARLGGATYKGVNAPYISISPGSALQAYTGYDSSIYSTDVSSATSRDIARVQTSSNEFIAQYQKTMDVIMQGNEHDFKREYLKLSTAAEEYLKNVDYTNDYKLAEQALGNEKELKSLQSLIDRQLYIDKRLTDKDYELSLFYIKNYGLDLSKYDVPDSVKVIANGLARFTRIVPGARGFISD